LIDRRSHGPPIGRRRRRDRDLRRSFCVSRDKLEVLDHRMAGKTDLADDLETFIAGRHRGERHARIHDVLFNAIEAPEKIEVPPGAAEFTVRDRLQSDIFLLFDDALDLAVFNLLKLSRCNLAFYVLLARFLQRRRPQQTADMIGTEWRFGTL